MWVKIDMWRPDITDMCSEFVEGNQTIRSCCIHIFEATHKAVNEVWKQEQRQGQRDSQISVVYGVRTSLLGNYDVYSAKH